jgi:triosephosphate isomerase
MRVPLIAGNWKMYKTCGQAVKLVQDLEDRVMELKGVEIVVCPPFTALKSVATVIEIDKPNFSLGAQDIFWEVEGAYTGEISPLMLKDLSVKYVIVGHSERRQYFKETNEVINKKLRAAIAHDIAPILCVGETLAEREKNLTKKVVKEEIVSGLEGFKARDLEKLVLAYEPIWAIGTGRTAFPEDANMVVVYLRELVASLFEEKLAKSIRILYGGSVKPENIGEFMEQPEIDGALVGGASLTAEDFSEICRVAEIKAGRVVS